MTCYQLLEELGWLEVYGKGGCAVAQILTLILAARITIVNSANISHHSSGWLPVQMVKFFFFVIINRFSIDEDFSFAKGFDGDLFRTFIFNFTVLLQDAKQMETTKTDMEIAKKLGNYMMRNIFIIIRCQLRVVLQKKKVQKMLKISPP